MTFSRPSLKASRKSAVTFLFIPLLGASAVSANVPHPTLIADTESAWKNPRVPVCFANSTTEISKKSSLHSDVKRAKRIYDHSDYEARIAMIVNREYTPDQTGITFTEWKSCDGITDETADAPAFIFADTGLSDFGITTVGDERSEDKPEDRLGLISGAIFNLRMVEQDKDYSTTKSARALMKFAETDEAAQAINARAIEIDTELFQQLRDMTVLHEIGHLAGLGHEERRKDAREYQPKWCRSADDLGKQGKSEKTFGLEFDPFSVMNYCSDDIAKAFAFYHLFCAFPEAAVKLEAKRPEFTWSAFSSHCAFMAREFHVGLSRRDQSGLRRIYLGLTVPAGSRSYRSNADEVEILESIGDLYDGLPDAMAFTGGPGKARPSRSALKRRRAPRRR